MSSLFDKIGTLINAQVNDLLGNNPKSPLARIRLDPRDAEKSPRQSARAIRRRLEEAEDYEDQLRAKIDGLMKEALDLDGAVDACLERGDQFGARRLQSQLNMKQQQIDMAEAELREHGLVTRHLMRELVDLEAALDSHEGQQGRQRADGQRKGQKARIPIDSADPVEAIADSVGVKLNEAREGIETLLKGEPNTPQRRDPGGKQRIVIVDEEPDPRKPKALNADKDKMNRRLSRLSGPGDD